MAADDRALDAEMIEQRHGVLGQAPGGEILAARGRSAGAALIVDDHLMVARELGDLIKLPGRAMPGGRGDEQQGRAAARDLVVDVGVVEPQYRHDRSSRYCPRRHLGAL
jgi:hypothetical protein